MKTQVEFRSDSFPPYEGEEDEINPGLYGKRLAEFLVAGLRNKGFETDKPIPEDWGWVVPIKNDSFKLWIGCGRYQEYPDGFLCFIEPHRPTINRFIVFGKIETTETVGRLRQALDEVLSSEPSIRDIRWWTHEEFNSPSVD